MKFYLIFYSLLGTICSHTQNNSFMNHLLESRDARSFTKQPVVSLGVKCYHFFIALLQFWYEKMLQVLLLFHSTFEFRYKKYYKCYHFFIALSSISRIKKEPSGHLQLIFLSLNQNSSFKNILIRSLTGQDWLHETEIYNAFPPDTLITCPVIILACSLARNKTVSAIS